MKHIVNFFKGIVVGIATLVPGVSGGTMAIVLGIYDDLIHAVASFFKDIKKHTIFLFEVGLGALLALLLFSRLLENVIEKYPEIMGFLFIGIICGGLPVLYKKATEQKNDWKDFIFLILGFIIVLIMSGDSETTTALATSKGFLSIVFLLIGGIIIAIALILPGISASFMLLTLNLYNVTLSAINNKDIPFLVPLGIGVVVGTLATARAIEKLLIKYPGKTYMLILGFVIGSLIPVFPGIPKEILNMNTSIEALKQGIFSLIISLGVLIIGFLSITWLSKKEIEEK